MNGRTGGGALVDPPPHGHYGAFAGGPDPVAPCIGGPPRRQDLVHRDKRG